MGTQVDIKPLILEGAHREGDAGFSSWTSYDGVERSYISSRKTSGVLS